jgi:hypothetical protein
MTKLADLPVITLPIAMACISIFGIFEGLIAMVGRQSLTSRFLGAHYTLGVPISGSDAEKDAFVRLVAEAFTLVGFLTLLGSGVIFLILRNGQKKAQSAQKC